MKEVQKQPEEAKQSDSILWLCKDLIQTVRDLNGGKVSPKVAHAKAHVAGKIIQGAALQLAHERLMAQNQIKAPLEIMAKTIDV